MSEPDANASCLTCDRIGPDADALTSSMRDLHRAFHDVYRTLMVAFGPMIEAAREQRERERLVTKNAFVLVNESYASHLRGER